MVGMPRYLLFVAWLSLIGAAKGLLDPDAGVSFGNDGIFLPTSSHSSGIRRQRIIEESFPHNVQNGDDRRLSDSSVSSRSSSSSSSSSSQSSSDSSEEERAALESEIDLKDSIKAFEAYKMELQRNDLRKAKQWLEKTQAKLRECQYDVEKERKKCLEKREKLDDKKSSIANKKKEIEKKKDELKKKKDQLEKKNVSKRELIARDLRGTTEIGQVEKELERASRTTKYLDYEQSKLKKEFDKIDYELLRLDKTEQALATLKEEVDAAEIDYGSQVRSNSVMALETLPTTALEETVSITSQRTEDVVETDNGLIDSRGEQEDETARDRIPNDGSRFADPIGLTDSDEPVDGEEDEFDFFVGLTPHLQHCQATELEKMDEIMTAIMRVGFMDIDIYFHDFEEEKSPVRRLMWNETGRDLQTAVRKNRYGYTGHACRRCKNGKNGKKKKRSTGKRQLFQTIYEVDDPLDYEYIAMRMSETIRITVVETFAMDPMSCLGRGRPPEISVQLMVPVSRKAGAL